MLRWERCLRHLRALRKPPPRARTRPARRLRGRPRSRAPRRSCPTRGRRARHAARPGRRTHRLARCRRARLASGQFATREPAPAVQDRALPTRSSQGAASRRAKISPRLCEQRLRLCLASLLGQQLRVLELRDASQNGISSLRNRSAAASKPASSPEASSGSDARARRAAADVRRDAATRSSTSNSSSLPASPHSNAASSASTTPSFLSET